MPEPTNYPLLLEPILLEKVWGGRRLAQLGKSLSDGAMVGESWEVADLAATSASGAGGEAKRSVIRNGPLVGRTLADVGPALWGDADSDAGFPLLVKLLDARENLSIQVHPSPAYAAEHPDAHLKTECWYVLDADEGSVIYKGVKPGVTASDFRAAIDAGTVPEVMHSVPAVVGEMHELPSGTVHALGAGVLVAEFQTPSDTTYRVFDWGRTDRELHIEQAMACIDFGPAPDARTAADGVLCDNEFFRVAEVRGHCEAVDLGLSRCAVVMIVGGMGASIASKADAFEEVQGRPGSTMVIPAGCAADAVLRAGPGTVCLVAEVS
ncbi:MAG: type I phosphomannose isomerase catalytic subunit [Planctomycetota bacterium]